MSKEHPWETAAKTRPPEQSHAKSLSPTREDQAREEIGHTEITATQARLISVLFLATLCWVPFTQHRMGFREYQRNPAKVETLKFYKAFDGVWGKMAAAWRGGATPLKRNLDANAVLLKQIHEFEETLDDVAWVTQRTQAPMQALMCRMGVGNEKAFIGRDGWLFFEPGVSYLTGPGFLKPRQLKRRARSGDETSGPVQPDPVAGIVHFRDQLRQYGVELLVVPIPVKPSIHPDAFSPRYTRADAPLQSESFGLFMQRLAQQGVSVFDPSDVLCAYRDRAPAYLKTDTHWTPGAMQATALAVATKMQRMASLPPVDFRAVHTTPVNVTHIGDIVDPLLKLPTHQTIFARETVTLHPVSVEADAAADVLLLGDSFANIYSHSEMNWGTNAGFAYQLSAALGRPVEAIIKNDRGASATRRALAISMQKGDGPLVGKQLVVWLFAARELAIGDWKHITLTRRESSSTHTQTVSAVGVSSGTVSAVSDPPLAGAVYKDFIFKMHVTGLVDERGEVVGDGEGVVSVFGMRNRKILKIAAVGPGDKVAFTLRPWEEVASRYGTIKSGELEDMMLEVEKAIYWGEPVE